jgi:hypothetical protein
MGYLFIFHTSYLPVIQCHPLALSVAIVLTIVFAIGLTETTPTDWTPSKRLLLSLFYFFWAECVITIYCYQSGFPS